MTLLDIPLADREQPLELIWPSPAGPVGVLRFETPDSWRAFIVDLGIHPAIPQIVTGKFARAQTLYLLGWIDMGLVKAGELAALIALELALTDRYGGHYPAMKPSFSKLLRHLVEKDGLTDAAIPMVAKCGGTAVGQLIGDVRPTLAERRNSLAHGDPFEGWPTSGLLELARDLINYAYRDYIAELAGQDTAS
jgi:hypothetical protein